MKKHITSLALRSRRLVGRQKDEPLERLNRCSRDWPEPKGTSIRRAAYWTARRHSISALPAGPVEDWLRADRVCRHIPSSRVAWRHPGASGSVRCVALLDQPPVSGATSRQTEPHSAAPGERRGGQRTRSEAVPRASMPVTGALRRAHPHAGRRRQEWLFVVATIRPGLSRSAARQKVAYSLCRFSDQRSAAGPRSG